MATMNSITRRLALLVLLIGFLLLIASNSLHTQGVAPPAANQIGRLTSSGNGLRRTAYEYDELGRATRTVNNFEGQSKAFTTAFGYPQSQVTLTSLGTVPTSQTFPDNERVDYTYDASGAQQSIKTTPAGGLQQTIVSSIFRNSRGQTIAASYGNGAVSIYKYNESTNLRLNQIQTAVGGTLTFTGGVPQITGGTTLQDYGYTFDNNGNIIGVTDAVTTSLNATYGYDSLDQLTSMTPAGQALLPYSYDRLANLTNKENVVQSYGGAQSCEGCAPNRGPHALASAGGVTYNYDFNGNLVSTSNGTLITWNSENMPTRVVQNGNTLYQKSFVGESLWKKVEPGMITHYLPSMRIENEQVRKSFGNFAERSPDGSLKFYHGDQLGSASLVTNQAGQMIRRQAYKPYGEDRFIDPNSTFTPKYQFTLKEKEELTGIYDFGARLYNPITGRWLSADDDPTDGLNRYMYVGNNPLNRVDPDGHQQQKPVEVQPCIPGGCPTIVAKSEWDPLSGAGKAVANKLIKIYNDRPFSGSGHQIAPYYPRSLVEGRAMSDTNTGLQIGEIGLSAYLLRRAWVGERWSSSGKTFWFGYSEDLQGIGTRGPDVKLNNPRWTMPLNDHYTENSMRRTIRGTGRTGVASKPNPRGERVFDIESGQFSDRGFHRRGAFMVPPNPWSTAAAAATVNVVRQSCTSFTTKPDYSFLTKP